jgi:hypothetical protein
LLAGDSYPQCLQAATELRGNCVANIDYRGPKNKI